MEKLGTVLFRELSDQQDELLFPWLDLYETAFPANERILVSNFLRILRTKGSGQDQGDVLLAAVGHDRELVGMAHYRLDDEIGAAFLWYLAVAAQQRNGGVGTLIYQKIVGDIDREKYRALVFDLEIPALAPDAENARLAERRIQFYRRNGAFLLHGIDYEQRVGPHQSPIRLHIMLHPFKPLDGAQAFEIVKRAFGDAVQQVGPLNLE